MTDIVILGLSITSSWGNGHATNYRALVKELVRSGHRVLFLERDVPWYAAARDLPSPPYGETVLYENLGILKRHYAERIADADLVIVGSYVPEGGEVGDWVTSIAGGVAAFYDIDTPVTLSKLESDACEYLNRDLIPRYDLYLSFSGGLLPDIIEHEYGSPCARAFYCAVDADSYYPEPVDELYDLGYLGTYSADRQPVLDRMLMNPARRWREGRFAVAGSQYPAGIAWPGNVRRIEHLPPDAHRGFYSSQRFTLNVTRSDMVEAGWSPSVRLFEAAACGIPIMSDYWDGMEEFFLPGEEIIIPWGCDDILSILMDMPEDERRRIGSNARRQVLARHTAAHRVRELETYVREAVDRRGHHAVV